MMSRGQTLLLNISIAGMTITGAVFAWMKYAMKTNDPFAVANHPWQPHMMTAHVLIGPLAVFAFGWTFANHIWPRIVLQDPRRRLSGLSATILIAPMIVSGYLLQIATSDTIRHAMAIAHGIASALFVIAYVAHLARRS